MERRGDGKRSAPEDLPQPSPKRPRLQPRAAKDWKDSKRPPHPDQPRNKFRREILLLYRRVQLRRRQSQGHADSLPWTVAGVQLLVGLCLKRFVLVTRYAGPDLHRHLQRAEMLPQQRISIGLQLV